MFTRIQFLRTWWPRALALGGVALLMNVPGEVRGEGSYQIGLNQQLYEYDAVNPLLLNITRPVYVDILTPGEVINVSFCGQLSGDDLRVRIYDPNSVQVWNQLITSANCNCTDSFNLPLTNPIRYTTATAGRYEVRLFNDSRTDGRFLRFDISVTPNAVTNPNPTVAAGRVHAQSWAYNALDYTELQSTDADYFILVPVNGALDTTYVWKLDLNNLAGFVYEILGNSVGLNPPASGLSGPQSGNSVAVNYQIYLGYPVLAGEVATIPPLLGGFGFVDDQGVDATISPSVTIGIQDQGVFTFTSSVAGTYAITIDETGDGIFGAGDVLLLGAMVEGLNTVPWNGRRNDGSLLPVGDYQVQLTGRIGEYHFICGDVETSGGPSEAGLTTYQATGPSSTGDVLVYWDDFTLLGGGFTVPDGRLSSTPQGHHTWGTFTGTSFGNDNYIDTHVYGLTSFTQTTAGITDDDDPAAAVVGIAKTMTKTGTDTVTVELRVDNLGTVDLDSLRVGENLDAAFGAGNYTLVGSPALVVDPGTVVLDPAFTGAGADTHLVTPASTLAEGDSLVLRLVLAATVHGVFTNQASAAATSGYGSTQDLSDEGTDPDPNDNGDPTESGENDPSSVVLETPALAVTKTLPVPPGNRGDGTYNVVYRLTVENTGDVPLTALRVSDDLAATFAGATAFLVDSVRVVSGVVTLDPAFTGSAPDTNVLAGSDTLGVGASAAADLYMTVTPGANLGPYANTAGGSAQSLGLVPVTGGSGAVPVTFVENPGVTVTKAVSGSPVNNGDGTYALTYRLTVTNTGDVGLSDLLLFDDLDATFASATYVVDSVRVVSGSLTLDPAFTGSDPDTSLLLGADVLPVGDSGAVDLFVTVTPGANLGPYVNAAGAEGTTPASATTTDGSSAVPVTFLESAGMAVTKVVQGGPVNLGDGTYAVTYRLTATNTGDVGLLGLLLFDDLDATFASAPYVVDSVRVVSGSLTLDPAFTGSDPDTSLLLGSDTLLVGASGAVDLFVTVTPGGNLGPYGNAAGGEGTTPSTATVSGGSGSVPVSFVETPGIEVTKSLHLGPDNNGDGTYALTYRLMVANTGDVALTGVTLSDDLAAAFAGAAVMVDSLDVVSGSVTLDPAYTGSAPDTSLLLGSDTLSVGESALVDVHVTVSPGANLGPYGNAAGALGTAPSSAVATGASGMITVSFGEAPALLVTKAALGPPVNHGDGTYGVAYRLTVENTGDVRLTGVAVSDDLAATFAGASAFAVDSVRVVSGSLTLDPTYTGTAPETTLLAGGDTLSVGGSGTVDLFVTVTPGANLGPYGNAASGEGTSPSVTTVSGGSGFVPVSFGETPGLDVTKSVQVGPVNHGDGTYSLAYRMTVVNTGDVSLSGIRLSDDLAATFAGASVTVDSVRVVTGSLTLDLAYTGSAPDTNLLSGSDTLSVGLSGAVDLFVTVTPGANLGPYGNAASGEGTAPSSATVSGGSGSVPVSFTETPGIDVSKSVQSPPVNHGDGTYSLAYRMTVVNTGDVSLSGIQLSDDLAATFAGASVTVDSVRVVTGSLTLDLAYTGSAPDTNLLTGSDTLSVGGSGALDLFVTVTPGANLGPYGNAASGEGTAPSSATVSGGSGSVPVSFTETPGIDVSKSVQSPPVNHGDGTYSLAYRVTVANTGDVALSGIALNDNLAVAFVGASVTVDSVRVVTGSLTLDLAYTGIAPDTNLLSGSDTLSVGGSGAVDLFVTVTPGANLGPYGNAASGEGTSPSAATVSGGSGSVPVSFTESPGIDVSKSVQSAPVNHGDGTYSVTYRMTVANTGDVSLSAVQLSDDLGATFAGATGFTVDSVRVVAGPLTLDPGYTGSAPDTSLLLGSDTLAVGASGAVDLFVTVTPGANLGPYGNAASGEGTSPSAATVSGGSGSVPVSFTESPGIDVSKSVQSAPVNHGDGTYSVTYRMTVANTGDVSLSAVQLSDDLGATFAGATGFTVDSVRVVAGPLTLDPGYTGSAPDTSLLLGSDTLAVGASGAVDLFVTVTPGANLGPYGNAASGEGTTPTAATVSGGSGSVPVSFGETPGIDVTKTVPGIPVNHGDGTYSVTYRVTVANTGDVSLSAIQLSDDLAATFAGATGFTVDSVRVATGSLTLDPAYTGSAPDTNLLAGSDTLSVGGSGAVDLFVTVTPGGNLGPYGNQASGQGTSPSAIPVGDDTGTIPVNFGETPGIGVAKAVIGVPQNRGDGTYGLTYRLVVENSGNVPLVGLAVGDPLDATFAGAQGFTVDSVRVVSGSVTFDPAYTGSAPDTNLFAGVDTLAVGASVAVDLFVTVTPGANLGPYGNTAYARGTTYGGADVTDGSVDGLDPDGNGNGDPADDGGATPVTFQEAPALSVTKAVQGTPVNHGDGTYGVTYRLTVANPGDVRLSAIQVSDDLSVSFAGALSFVVDSVLVVSGAVTPDPAYTGSAPDTNLLAGGDTLLVGAAAVLDLFVTVTPGGNLGPYGNAAATAGTSPALTAVSGGSGSVPVTFGETPAIGLAKAVLGVPVNRGDGTYGVTYRFTVDNGGDVAVGAVQLSDDLAVTFAGAQGFAVDSVRVVSGGLTLDPSFTGSAPDTNLLLGGDTLAVGGSGAVDLFVTVTPGGNLGPYGNTGGASGTSQAGTDVTDEGAAPVTFVETPALSITKAVLGVPTSLGGGLYRLTYRLTVENTGDVRLTGVQVSDDLTAAFAAALGFTVDSVRVVSGPLTLDPAYTGSAPDTNLLAGGNALDAGASSALDIHMTVSAGTNLGPYDNAASGEGSSPASTPVTDGSGPTPVTFGETPGIGVAKAVIAGPVNRGDGTYGVIYRLTVENLGNAPLTAIDLFDDLNLAFTGAVTFTVDSVRVASGSLTPDPGYTGIAPDTSLLAGSDPLAVAASAAVDLFVTVTPGTNLGPYGNTAFASGTSVGGLNVADGSVNGLDPDANGNGDAGDDAGATPVSFTEAPQIQVAKAVLGAPVNQGNGAYSVTYRISVENSGDVPLGALELSDDLGAAFAGASFTVDSVRVASGPLTLLPAYRGSAPDTNLLVGADVLPAGTTAAVDIHVTVTPSTQNTFTNLARGAALSPGGAGVAETAGVPVTLTEAPRIGLAKGITGGPVNQGDGTYRLTYRLTVENPGDVALSAVQVSDDLGAAFAGVQALGVDSVRVVSGGLTLDPSFTGSAPDTNLLAGTDGLAAGARGVIDVVVVVSPGSNLGPFLNLALAQGTSPLATRVTDLSVDGFDPDPDGDGDPGDDTGGTPVTFVEGAEVGVAKAVSEPPVLGADGSYSLAFSLIMVNSGQTVLDSVQLVDDLAATFPEAVRITVDDIQVMTTGGVGIAQDPAYDGVGTTTLLAAGGRLPAGGVVSVEIRISVDAGDGLGPYYNVATGRGLSPSGILVSDQSAQGLLPDADGDGNPGNDDDPTEVVFPNQVVSILLDKEADARDVVIGDLVGYRLRATNALATPADDIVIEDELPAGFQYVDGSARLLRAGRDGVLGTGDDVGATIVPQGQTQLVFPGVDLAAGEAVLVSYLLRVGAGVVPGDYVNTARPTADGAAAGNTVQASVTVTDDPILNATTLIGKVFLDRDGDGVQDPDTEPGLPGVRLVTAEGLVVETDRHGRYHIADVDGGRWERGRNVIIKVDPATLPEGASFTTENPRTLRITPALMSKIDFGVTFPEDAPLVTPGGATLWATQDPGALDPRLDVAGPEVTSGDGSAFGSATFRTYCNYPSYLTGWELVIYRPEDGPEQPLAVMEGDRLPGRVLWEPKREESQSLVEGEELRYLLRVRGSQGQVDETRPRSLVLRREGSLEEPGRAEPDMIVGVEGGEVYGQTSLARQTIPLTGGRVRLRGEGLPAGAVLRVDGEDVPVDARGAFAAERMLPAGEHDLAVEVVEPDGTTWQRALHVTVEESSFFMVGIADVTLGQNAVSGDVAPLAVDDHFDEDVFVDGRVAFHLKGKIQGKYLLTAHMDTEEKGLDDLAGDLHEKDARGLLRRLDPDRFYPVYGDESTTLEDAASQGKLYARLEWNHSRVLWGNYHTGITGTEFAEYNRSLYGAQAAIRSTGTSRFGDSRGEVTAFLSEAQSRLGHNEFLATGGSLYYLHDADIVQGSEKVWVEVRDRDSERVLERVALERARDYELDDIQGRILLNRPLLQVVRDAVPSIVKDTPLDGNDVFLLVDYEYVPDGFQAGDATYGARGKTSPVDAVSVGGTLVHETRGAEDYDLRGVDAALRGGEGTFLKAEYAESEETQALNGLFSDNGGLTFFANDTLAAGSRGGRALGVEGRIDLSELTSYRGRAEAGAWWKTRDAGFSTARLGRGTETTEYGMEGRWRPGDRFTLSAKGVQVERTGSAQDLSLGVQGTSRFGALDVTGEVRHTDHDPEAGTSSRGTLGAAGLGYTGWRGTRVYGVGQVTLDHAGDYAANDLVTAGVDAPVTAPLRLRAEGSTGDRGRSFLMGAGLTAGSRVYVDIENARGNIDPHSRLSTRFRLSDDHELYGTYTMSPDRTEGSRNAVTVGQRKTLANQLRIFTESQFQSREDESGLAHVFGLDYEPTPTWTLHGSLQSSHLEQAVGGDVERDVISVSVVHESEPARASSKLEYRRDRGATHRIQWVTANRFDRRMGENFTLQGKLNLSHTEDQVTGDADARFVETGLGVAYRPVASDRLQLLAKYTFLYDLPSEAQAASDRDERLHVGSVEGLYDLTPRFGVGGKVASRWEEARPYREGSEWFETRTWLALGRFRYHVVRNWDALFEYRWLAVTQAQDQRHGALMAVYRDLGPYLQGGLGFNFTSYSDDLTRTDYNHRGVFLNLVGRY